MQTNDKRPPWCRGVDAGLRGFNRQCPDDLNPLESHDWYEGYDLSIVILSLAGARRVADTYLN
jgi:hypothetical protein